MKLELRSRMVRLNLLVMLVGVVVLILTGMEILALNYGYEGRMNRLTLFALILIHGLCLLLGNQIPDAKNRSSLYSGLLLLSVIIQFIFLTQLEVDYKFSG